MMKEIPISLYTEEMHTKIGDLVRIKEDIVEASDGRYWIKDETMLELYSIRRQIEEMTKEE